MYKIEFPQNGEDVAYAKAYAAKLIPLINEYLNNGKVVPYGKEEAYADSYFV